MDGGGRHSDFPICSEKGVPFQMLKHSPRPAAMALAVPDEEKMSEANRRQVQEASASVPRPGFQDSIGEKGTGRLTAARSPPCTSDSVAGRIVVLRNVGFREIIFSVNCFIAVMLSLFIAFRLELKNPWWAMITVYLTSQTLSGAMRAKAVSAPDQHTALGEAIKVFQVPTDWQTRVIVARPKTGWLRRLRPDG
jgi:Fusaric acid resistance protein family